MGWGWWIVESRYEWSKDGFGDLLMMALPHHLDILDREGGNVAVVMADGYQSIKVREGTGVCWPLKRLMNGGGSAPKSVSRSASADVKTTPASALNKKTDK